MIGKVIISALLYLKPFLCTNDPRMYVKLYAKYFCFNSYNDGREYKEKYTGILLRCQYGKFQAKLLEAAKHNHQRKLDVLLELLKEFKLKPLSVPAFSEISKLLHTIILFSGNSG